MKTCDLTLYSYTAKDRLFLAIQAMYDYGVLLKVKGKPKGDAVINLAESLNDMTHQFFSQATNQRNFAQFKSEFLILLHSEDREIRAYSVNRQTILANISIALTGVGLLLIAGKLIYSKATKPRALFFMQSSHKRGEEKIADIEREIAELM